MTTNEAAASLGVSPVTVRRAIANGTIRARKVGRDWHVTPAAVERYRTASLSRPGRRAKPPVSPVTARHETPE